MLGALIYMPFFVTSSLLYNSFTFYFPHLSSEDAFPELFSLLFPSQLPFPHNHRPFLGAIIQGPWNPDSMFIESEQMRHRGHIPPRNWGVF